MTKNSTSPYSIPELTSEECKMLISILYQIECNMKPFLTTPHLSSSCSFIFNTDEGKDKAFRGLYHKVQEMVLHTKSDESTVKQEEIS